MKDNLSKLVSRRINELGTTKAAIAKKAGLSRTYITDIANGTANTQSGQYRPKPEIVSALAKALELSESEILTAIGYSMDDMIIPEELAVTGFDGLDKEDLKDIADYINFKKMQKKVKESN